jgi:hypothetical protein
MMMKGLTDDLRLLDRGVALSVMAVEEVVSGGNVEGFNGLQRTYYHRARQARRQTLRAGAEDHGLRRAGSIGCRFVYRRDHQ